MRHIHRSMSVGLPTTPGCGRPFYSCWRVVQKVGLTSDEELKAQRYVEV